MNADRLAEWRKVYQAKLAEGIQRHPSQYHNHDAASISETCQNTLTTKGVRAIQINAVGWKASAKHFGIANTYMAWEAFFGIPHP